MATVSVHPPKTPVTKGSLGIAKATVPNVCKMPGPPAPFVPTPLPNLGKSGDSAKDYSTGVKIEGQYVAIRGATFGSMGDIASKATGGGLISSNTHGPTKFISPGSLTVKIEGKGVHFLGEPMLNNCGASGSPPNAATMGGVDQLSAEEKAQIREEMRREELVCPSGNPGFPEHAWEEDAREPPGSTKDSIETLQSSNNPATKFEGDAAARNVADGDMTIPPRDRSSKVSRDPTEAEEKDGASGDDHKVFRHCTRQGCGHRAEVDHKTDTGQAEAKNVNRFDSFKQMRRNASIQRQTGASMTYKINGALKNSEYVKQQIEYAAKVVNLRVLVKVII
jgi:uncharacterized Zn-binding protein involved in type VI secretion